MVLRLHYGQREVNDRPSTGSRVVTIRKRRDGWQVIVYAGLDPLTGKQRQLTRQINGSRRQAEKIEARLRTEVADGQHAGTRLKTLGELVDLWIERRAASDKPISPDTVQDYRSLIAKKIKLPKSVHGERLLALDAVTVELLRVHRVRCERLAEQLGGRLDPQAYVFARTPDGRTPFRPDTVSKRFTALVRRLGHDYTLYGLRHFMATQLGAVAEAGTVRERMGHGSLAVTSGYMHRVSEADRAAAEFMGGLLDRDARQQADKGPRSTT
jgi:hypothetical protein